MTAVQVAITISLCRSRLFTSGGVCWRYQIRRIEIILTGNPDQRKQGIAPSVG